MHSCKAATWYWLGSTRDQGDEIGPVVLANESYIFFVLQDEEHLQREHALLAKLFKESSHMLLCHLEAVVLDRFEQVLVKKKKSLHFS